MSRLSMFTIVVIICAFGVGSVSAQTTVSTQSPIAAIQQLYGANVQAAAPTDITIYGTITDEKGVTQQLQVEIKGSNKLRYEIGTGTGKRVTIYNSNQGWTQVGTKLTALQSYSSVRRPSMIPSLDLISEYQNPLLAVTDQGTQLLGTQTVRHLSLLLPDTVPLRPFGRKFNESLEVYFDPTTQLVARTDRFRYAEENMDLQIPTTMEFSNYRLIGNLSVPFQIITTTGSADIGTHQTTLIVSQVLLNTGVPDSDFLPAGGSR